MPSEEMDDIWLFIIVTYNNLGGGNYELVLRAGEQVLTYPFAVRWLSEVKNGIVIGDKSTTATSPFNALISHIGIWKDAVLTQAHFDQGKTKIPLDQISTTDLSGTASNVPMLEYFKLGADLQSEVSATVLTHSGTAVFSADNPFTDTSLPVTYTQVANVGIVMTNYTRGIVKPTIQAQSSITEQLFVGNNQSNSITEVQ